MMGTYKEASRLALLKPYDKKMGAHDRISSDPAIYMHQVPKIDGESF
jgi:hypothetical protein